MIFNSKTMIPQVYGKERTIQVFTTLIDMLLTCCKHDIDSLGNVYNAIECPETLLPFLGKTINYNYNFSDTVTSNRNIIYIFSLMEKYRGSQLGLRMATALSLTGLNQSKNNNELIFSNLDYITAMQQLDIEYDYENARIIITYPNIYTLVRYILDYVRPVGMTIELKSVVFSEINADTMLIYADVENDVHEYNPEIDSFVNRSFVNFSSTVDPNWLHNLSSNNIDMNS